MIATDGYAYLNIAHSLCAWATYRGTLVSSQAGTTSLGTVSIWLALLIEISDPDRMSFESKIEKVRLEKFPHCVSRLTGLYCFLTLDDAERAGRLWGDHFKPEHLAELTLVEATGRERHDSNWILYPPRDQEWIEKYWRGDAMPGHEPIWETLVNGRIDVLGTELRKRAYKLVKQRWPESLMLLEIGRQAAWVGSDLGNIAGFLAEDGDDLVLTYAMDMRDADKPEFLAKLDELKKGGHPINWADMKSHIENDTFGCVPDMKEFMFRRPKALFSA